LRLFDLLKGYNLLDSRFSSHTLKMSDAATQQVQEKPLMLHAESVLAPVGGVQHKTNHLDFEKMGPNEYGGVIDKAAERKLLLKLGKSRLRTYTGLKRISDPTDVAILPFAILLYLSAYLDRGSMYVFISI
jgi:hypothetical protein